MPAFLECFAQENCRWKQLCERRIVQKVGSRFAVLQQRNASRHGKKDEEFWVSVCTKRYWQTALMIIIIIITMIIIIIIIIIMQFPFYLFSSLCSLINRVY